MPRTDVEQLVVSLEARVKDFERGMARAQRSASRSFGGIERTAERTADRMERTLGNAAKNVGTQFASLGKSLAAGLAGGAVVASLDGVVGRLGSITRSVADIGREARRAGVDVATFQEFGAVAARTRIPIDSLVDGLKELNLRADEFVTTGKGSAAEAFERLGFSASELRTALAEPGDLLIEIIGRLEDLDRAAQIRIADEIFGGTAGERFVELLDRGAEGVREIIEQANATGQVLDAELIAKAEEIDEKFAQIGRTVSTNLKRAIVEAVGALDEFFARFRSFNELSARQIEERLRANGLRKLELEGQLIKLRSQERNATPGDPFGTDFAEQLLQVQEEFDALTAADEELVRALGQLTDRTREAGGAAEDATTPVRELGEAAGDAGGGATTGAGAFKSFADAIRALKDEIPELRAELAALDAAARVDAAYEGAMMRADSITDRMMAQTLRNEALGALDRQRAGSDAVAYLKPKLAAGKPDSYIDDLARSFADKLAAAMAAAPKSVRDATTINSGARSIERQQMLWERALQKYGSEAAARKWVAPPGKSQHNSGNAADLGYATDEARKWWHRNAPRHGLSFPMGHEPWHIEDAQARRRHDDSTAGERYRAAQREQERLRVEAARERARAEREAGREAAAAEREAATAKEKSLRLAQEQADAYGRIVGEAREFVAVQGDERASLDMTAVAAAALRYERQMLNEAERAGIELTREQRAEIAALAQQMAQAEGAVNTYARSQEEANAVSEFFGSQAVDALTGIITGTQSAEQALQGLIQALVRAALQAAILGEGPLAGLLKGGGGGGASKGGGGGKGKGAGGILGGLLGLASGGPVSGPGGPTDDKVPALLSNGEFVVRASMARKHRALLETINAGGVPRFAQGGPVGLAPPVMPNVHPSDRGGDITINTKVQVDGSRSGKPEENADLAAQIGAQLEQQMRSVVLDEMRQQMRAGNAFGRL